MALKFYGLRKFTQHRLKSGALLRVGIPKVLKEEIGWEPGDLIEVWADVEKGAVVLRRARQLERRPGGGGDG